MGARKEPLVVEGIHMYEKENAKAHQTYSFEVVHQEPATPVLRRGQIFDLAIRFDREYEEDVDIVRLLFSFGGNPNTLRGTQGVGSLNAKKKNEYLDDLETWGVKLLGKNGKDLMVQVCSPVNSPVGLWTLHVETTTLGSRAPPNTYKRDKGIYLLFNPWHKDDLTYMEDKELLNEYILSDVGKIWVGPYGSSRGRAWSFGQFDACVLPACLLMFERSGLRNEARGDPVKVARAISRIVNANDDDGVLTGNWSGDYEGGTAPASWTGSVPILEEFLKKSEDESEDKSVNYGQCWVFAGVATTVCRALGLPSRVVTNLVSAHDANATLSIDRFYDENNTELEIDPKAEVDPNDPESMWKMDSIWNYHVWNEVWMARPDLPTGYGGWQAIDATPQEKSEKFHQCGPTSVEAIRQGAVGYNYDVSFMIATVNADLIRWKADPTLDFGYSKIDSNNYHIGRMILTKAPSIFDLNGDQDREDITSSYKALEGTDAERRSLLRAVRSTRNAEMYYKLPSPKKEDVEFDLVDLDRVNIGQPFTVTVNMNNKSSEKRTVSMELSAGSVYYNGIKAKKVKAAAGDFVLHPNAREQLRLNITVDDYFDKLVEYSIMKLSAIGTVKETNQTWADEDDFQVLKPTIEINIEGDHLVVGKSFPIILSFRNPLKRPLTKCQFKYAGPGLSKEKTLRFRDVAPEEEVRVEHELVPQKSGEQRIVATFDSTELTDITGCTAVPVFDH